LNILITRKQVYWLCQLYGWGLYAVLLYVVNLLQQPNMPELGWASYLPFLAIPVFGILLTHAFRVMAIRNGWVARPLGQQLAIILIGAVVLGVIHNLFLIFIKYGTDGPDADFRLLNLVNNLVNLSALYLLWIVIYFAINYFTNYKKEEIAKLRQQAMLHQMELHTLRSQINPHFIFNALNGIRALVMEDPKRAQEAVTQLARLLRNVLRTEHYDLIPLEQELALVQDYLALEQIRYEERLQVHIHHSSDTRLLPVPALSVLTLAENAIKHGIAPSVQGGVLEVSAHMSEKGLCITVRNPGQLQQQPKATDDSGGYGLRNIRQRLALLYGEAAALTVAQQPDTASVSATLCLPVSASAIPNIRTL
jgi:two-component system LytT family sensor kinase